MATIVTTRFNKTTWEENKEYRERHDCVCIYPVPKKVCEDLDDNAVLFVIEMNNTTNKIEGIGLIRNKIENVRHNVYRDNNFNCFCYVGKYRVERECMDTIFLENIETLLFKGKSHYKRGIGLTALTDKMKRKTEMDFYKEIKQMFMEKYKKEELYKEGNINEQ